MDATSQTQLPALVQAQDAIPMGAPSPRPRLVAQAMAGVVVVLITLSSLLSYAALLFGPAPPAVQAQGLFMLLVSSIVLGAVGALFSSLPVSLVAHDGSSVAVMAAVTGALIAGLAGAEAGVLGATLVAGLAATSALTGVALLALGWARGGAVVRFLPLQVMAGLLAASGWSLLTGGVAVATGQPADPALLQAPGAMLHLAPAVGWAVLMLAVTRQVRSPLALPAMVLAGIGLHHAVFAGLGHGLARQRAEGWLLPAPGALLPAVPWSPDMLARVDWGALLHQAPAIGAAVAVTCVLVLVNANGLELAAKQDVDLDRDLRANGAANLLAGLAGGVTGDLSMTRSALLHRLGARSRAVPLLATAAVGVIPMAVPGILGLVPRTVMGALLLLLAFGLLDTWLVQVRRRLARAEWLTVPAVVLVAAWFGLPAAVFAGLALGCVTFAVMYSLGSPIRARYRGDVARSNVDRGDAERAALLAQADAVLVIYLQGFLFFGTASRLLQEVKSEVARSAGTLRHLVLDCSNIDGLDGSARATLERLQQVVSAHGITLTYAALPPAAARQLGKLLRPLPGLAGPGSDAPGPRAPGSHDDGTYAAPTLDAALERCEAALLVGHPAPPAPSLTLLLAGELDDPADAAALQAALAPSTVPQGVALMAQGEGSDHLVFLARGHASVTVAFGGGPEVRVRQFGPGTMIGEIGFLLGEPRTATVRAMTDCDVWTLTRAAMRRLEAERPGAALALQRAVMARLSRRLLDKDHLIAALMRGTRQGS